MKRLLSLLLVIAMLFGVCTIFTACDSTSSSSSDEDDDDKKKDEEEKEVEPTLLFHGLKIVLPEDFEVDNQNDYIENGGFVHLIGDSYSVNVSCGPMGVELEGMNAKELRDYYMDMFDAADEDNEIGEIDTGKKNGTYYLYAVKNDKTAAVVFAFYVDDDYFWSAQVASNEDEEFDIEEMIKLVTGWKYKKPDPSEEGPVQVPTGNPDNEQPDQPEEPVLDGPVLYENLGIVVKWVDTYIDDYSHTFTIYIENNSGYEIELQSKDMVVNGTASVEEGFYHCVGDGDIAQAELRLFGDMLERYGIEHVGRLDFNITITNAFDYQPLDENVPSCIVTEYDGCFNTPDSDGPELFYKDGIRVILQDIEINGEYDSCMWLYVENLSEKTVSLSMEDFSAMGWYLPDTLSYAYLQPSTYTITPVSLRELLPLGIEDEDDIHNIHFTIICNDHTDGAYDYMCHEEVTYAPGDPTAIQNVSLRGEELYNENGLNILLLPAEEEDYCVRYYLYFSNSSGSEMYIDFSDAIVNGVNSYSGAYVELPAGMQCITDMCLWYSEDLDFESLSDLKSLVASLELRDGNYTLIAEQDIEIPLN